MAGQPTAKGVIQRMLHQWGLDALANWAWTRYKQTGSMDLVNLEMQDRPEYKKRFAGRLALREQGVEMTEAEQLAYESQAHQVMRQAGMPPGFYDSYTDFQGLIGAGISMVELGTRINDAYLKVANAPQQVRSAMADYYGAGSDGALAALALDQTKAAPAILKQIAAAETGGLLAVQGVNINRTLAETMAKATGFEENRIQSAAQQVGQWSAEGVFNPLFGEKSGVGLDTGLEAAFEGDQRDVIQIGKQQEQRAASGQGTSAGPGGLGVANH